MIRGRMNHFRTKQKDVYSRDGAFRAFLALEIPPRIKDDIKQNLRYFRRQLVGYDFNWVPVENLHITLKFLGDITREQSQRIFETLGPLLVGYESFELKLSRLLYLPKKKVPKVIALAANPQELIIEISHQIERNIVEFGVAQQPETIKPHLTLARIKKDHPKHLSRIKSKPIYFHASQIVLYKSIISPEGARYESVWRIPFERNFNR